MRALVKNSARAAIAATVAWVLIGGVTTPAHTTTVALDREAGATACADGYHATPWREPILSGGGTLYYRWTLYNTACVYGRAWAATRPRCI